MKKVIIWIIIVIVGAFIALKYYLPERKSIVDYGDQQEIFDYYRKEENKITEEEEKQYLENIRNELGIVFVRNSEIDELGIDDVFIKYNINENEEMWGVEDDSYGGILKYYNELDIEEFNKLQSEEPTSYIETNNLADMRVLLARERFDWKTANVDKVIDIAERDKNVTYKATLDWSNVIELSEVPKEYVIDSFATYVDDNENITCYVSFKEK